MMIIGLFTLFCNNYNMKDKACQYYSTNDVFSPFIIRTFLSVLPMRSNAILQYFYFMLPVIPLILLLIPFLSHRVAGCELDQPTLDYWDQVEGMYDHLRKKENMISAVNNMNVETYQMFFKFCQCKYDVFIKNQTICKYIFIRHFRQSLITNKQIPKKRMKMKQSPDPGLKIQAFEVSLITF